MSANPRLTIVATSASLFRAEDIADPRFFIFATLLSGVLRFEVVARLTSGTRGAVTGQQFFAAMMAHFGSKVRIVEGTWRRAGGLTTNLDELCRGTSAGLSVEEAAFLTWTGQRALEYGYNTVTVVHALPLGAQGKYDDVRVQFSR